MTPVKKFDSCFHFTHDGIAAVLRSITLYQLTTQLCTYIIINRVAAATARNVIYSIVSRASAAKSTSSYLYQ